MTLDRLWAGWRNEYVGAAGAGVDDESGPACVFCRILTSGEPDEVTYVLWRGEHTFALLNAYPYTSGHLMVMPLRHVADLDELDDGEADELFRGVRRGVAAVKAAYRPGGLNVGANLGTAGGAGIPGHLHLHVLPRWGGDTNFMTAIAETRVLPETLAQTWRKLTEVLWAPDPHDTAAPAVPDDVRDELPAELDVTADLGPYEFPDNARRRIPGVLYLAAALVCVTVRLAAGSDAVLVNDGYFLVAGLLAALGVYCFLAGYPTAVDDTDALVAATRSVGFAVGHASAQLAWRGLRSRPIWRILLYSAEDPPAQRGLVLVDAVDGAVLEQFVESNPEDWTAEEWPDLDE